MINMIANTGYPPNTCMLFLECITKSIGIVTAEDPQDTHPSFKRRMSHARKVVDNYIPPKFSKLFNKRQWDFDNLNNFLFLKSRKH